MDVGDVVVRLQVFQGHLVGPVLLQLDRLAKLGQGEAIVLEDDD